MCPMGSSRWCPTPEQVMVLEDMYRGGLRSPNGSQIQQITSYLSFYGRIEGKNVFYWFQNHKARERQKMRRKLSKQLLLLHQHHHQQQQQHCVLPQYNQNAVERVAEMKEEDECMGGGSGGRPLITLQLFPLTAAENLKGKSLL